MANNKFGGIYVRKKSLTPLESLQKKKIFVVKKVLTAEFDRKKHNHSGKNILFTVVKGEVLVYLNESEQHHLTPGTVLQFDGENFINAKALKIRKYLLHL